MERKKNGIPEFFIQSLKTEGKICILDKAKLTELLAVLKSIPKENVLTEVK